MKCLICEKDTKHLFRHKILEKYEIQYYQCNNCKAVFTEKPYWLEEAYGVESGIADIDTGIMVRNIEYSRVVNALLHDFFPEVKRCVDYSGGHGIFTRLMRDLGWQYYWTDKYCSNLFARGFEWGGVERVDMLTAFEVVEHLDTPMETFSSWFEVTDNVLISTQTLIGYEKEGAEWWYFNYESGQHIVFYAEETLQFIARYYNKEWIKLNNSMYLFTDKRIPEKSLKRCLRSKNMAKCYIEGQRRSLVVADMNYCKDIIHKRGKE